MVIKTEEIKGKNGHKLKESHKINYNIYLVSSLTSPSSGTASNLVKTEETGNEEERENLLS